MLNFMINDEGKELVKNDDELRKKLSDCFDELPNAKIIDELSEAAKYYTNNGESNIAKYSFRLKDICLPTLLFNYFSYAFRSMWIYAAVLVAVFLISSFSINLQFLGKDVFFGYISTYLTISIVGASLYRFFLLKEFFQKYTLTPVTGFRARRLRNIFITIVFIVVVTAIIKMLISMIFAATVATAIHHYRF